ncbi:MAG: hypothetical protein K8E66_05780 [Phycisphaerales bacterium]|nr:hypothetical protein [Phycisphaerales bacterium]
MLIILPVLGGTRQPKKILAENVISVELAPQSAGGWVCVVHERVDIEFDEAYERSLGLAMSSPPGGWVIDVHERAIHWLGFVPGDESLSAWWRVNWVVETGSAEIVNHPARRLPPDALDALIACVESEVIGDRQFEMADQLDLIQTDPAKLAWGAGYDLTNWYMLWGFLLGLLTACCLIGSAVSIVVVPPRST